MLKKLKMTIWNIVIWISSTINLQEDSDTSELDFEDSSDSD